MDSERKISHDERRMLWLRASGAAYTISSDHDKNYYEFLKS
jgi:hypothetical protein